REVMDKLYSSAPDGYCGDEDNGQTSAWYVFSAMGFYPVCPGTDQYVLGSPLFKKVVLTLENGKELQIQAGNNTGETRYVKSLKLNGKNYNKNWISHFDIMKGMRLDFTMSPVAETTRGVSPADFPYSLSTEK